MFGLARRAANAHETVLEPPAVGKGLGAVVAGAALGATNGLLVADAGIPSIVITLATMLALRDALHLATGGEWVRELPARFQWFWLSQGAGESVIVGGALAIFIGVAWIARRLAGGRAMYAVGSDPHSAALVGLRPRWIVFSVFVVQGALVGLAALLQSLRFSDVSPSAGFGLEMTLIAVRFENDPDDTEGGARRRADRVSAPDEKRTRVYFRSTETTRPPSSRTAKLCNQTDPSRGNLFGMTAARSSCRSPTRIARTTRSSILSRTSHVP
jgi:hypothetical protein